MTGASLVAAALLGAACGGTSTVPAPGDGGSGGSPRSPSATTGEAPTDPASRPVSDVTIAARGEITAAGRVISVAITNGGTQAATVAAAFRLEVQRDGGIEDLGVGPQPTNVVTIDPGGTYKATVGPFVAARGERVEIVAGTYRIGYSVAGDVITAEVTVP